MTQYNKQQHAPSSLYSCAETNSTNPSEFSLGWHMGWEKCGNEKEGPTFLEPRSCHRSKTVVMNTQGAAVTQSALSILTGFQCSLRFPQKMFTSAQSVCTFAQGNSLR